MLRDWQRRRARPYEAARGQIGVDESSIGAFTGDVLNRCEMSRYFITSEVSISQKVRSVPVIARARSNRRDI